MAHSAAASFDAGSIARFATSANSTRSTSVVNRRPPSTLASAVSTPSWRHRPSRSQATPIGRDDDDRQPVTGRDITAAVVFAEIAVDRADQPAQTVRIEEVFAAEVQQHLRLGHPFDTPVVSELHVADDRAVTVLPLRRPQVHAHTIAERTNKCKHHGPKSCAHVFGLVRPPATR